MDLLFNFNKMLTLINLKSYLEFEKFFSFLRLSYPKSHILSEYEADGNKKRIKRFRSKLSLFDTDFAWFISRNFSVIKFKFNISNEISRVCFDDFYLSANLRNTLRSEKKIPF